MALNTIGRGSLMVGGKDMKGGGYGLLNDIHLARLRKITRNIRIVGNQTEIRSRNSTKASVGCPVAFVQGTEYEGHVRSSGM
jgi:hypothetical protein